MLGGLGFICYGRPSVSDPELAWALVISLGPCDFGRGVNSTFQAAVRVPFGNVPCGPRIV